MVKVVVRVGGEQVKEESGSNKGLFIDSQEVRKEFVDRCGRVDSRLPEPGRRHLQFADRDSESGVKEK